MNVATTLLDVAARLHTDEALVDGPVRLLDRLEDTIIRGGENIYSREAEFRLVDALPHNPSGKVLERRLTDAVHSGTRR